MEQQSVTNTYIEKLLLLLHSPLPLLPLCSWNLILQGAICKWYTVNPESDSWVTVCRGDRLTFIKLKKNKWQTHSKNVPQYGLAKTLATEWDKLNSHEYFYARLGGASEWKHQHIRRWAQSTTTLFLDIGCVMCVIDTHPQWMSREDTGFNRAVMQILSVWWRTEILQKTCDNNVAVLSYPLLAQTHEDTCRSKFTYL